MVEHIDTLEPLPVPEPERPPERRLTPREWITENLFSSRFNAALTVVFGAVLGWALYRAARFVFVTGRWEIVRANLTNFMVGLFPRDELWRPWAAVYVLVPLAGLRWGAAAARTAEEAAARGVEIPRASARTAAARGWPLVLLAAVLLALSGSAETAALVAGPAVLLLGGRWVGLRLPRRLRRWTILLLALGGIAAYGLLTASGGLGFDRWRGLMLTLFLAVAGIVLSFPLGVLLALGRRSTFPAIRAFSVAYIELIRGVPLVTLLFMSFLILGFFLPPRAGTPSLVTRALVAIVLFTAAYVAEIVRGGLQGVPKGQVEAAQAVGLSPVRVTAFIVLPQALRSVIPALVGQFISLFKDTSLVAIIGLAEILRVAQQITKQPSFIGQGLEAETLVFASFLFWVGAYWMSKSSQRLERRLGLGER